MMNLEVKRSNRISLNELAQLLSGVDTKLSARLLLDPNESKDLWATDFDLYKACLLLAEQPSHAILAKVLETVTIIPAEAAGETKRPISPEELEELRKVVL